VRNDGAFTCRVKACRVRVRPREEKKASCRYAEARARRRHAWDVAVPPSDRARHAAERRYSARDSRCRRPSSYVIARRAQTRVSRLLTLFRLMVLVLRRSERAAARHASECLWWQVCKRCGSAQRPRNHAQPAVQYERQAIEWRMD